MTFDQLALRAPTGSNCLLLRGPLKAREVHPTPHPKPQNTKP